MSSSACALVGSKLLKIQTRTAPVIVLSIMKVSAATIYDCVFTVTLTVQLYCGVHEKVIYIFLFALNCSDAASPHVSAGAISGSQEGGNESGGEGMSHTFCFLVITYPHMLTACNMLLWIRYLLYDLW